MSWRAFVKTFFLSLLGALAVLAVTAVVLCLTGVVNPNAVLRGVTAGRNERVGSAFSVSGEGQLDAAALGEGLLLLTEKDLRFYDGEGRLSESRSGAYRGALLDASGDWAAAYLPGGTSLWVYSKDGFAYEAKVEGEILGACVNSRGWLTVSWVEKRYQGAVTVYSDKGVPSYRIHAAEGYPLAAQAAPKGYDLAVLRLHEGGARLEVYDMRKTECRVSLELEGEIPAEIRYLDAHRLCCWGVRGVTMYDGDLNRLGRMELDTVSLDRVTVTPRFLTVSYRPGPEETLILVSLDRNMKVLGELELSKAPESLSQSGNYLALLREEELEIYDRDLRRCTGFTVNALRGRALQRPDGTVLVLSGDRATRWG